MPPVTAALPASTSRLAGMAVKVERIMPEAYSAVTDRTRERPEQHGGDHDAEQRAARRVERLALPGCHAAPTGWPGRHEDGPRADGEDQGEGGRAPCGGQGAKLRPLRLEDPADSVVRTGAAGRAVRGIEGRS